jgi:hypothetical protein
VPGKPGALPIFLHDVKPRHDRMIELVERRVSFFVVPEDSFFEH